jgi:hypothetical protein
MMQRCRHISLLPHALDDDIDPTPQKVPKTTKPITLARYIECIVRCVQ